MSQNHFSKPVFLKLNRTGTYQARNPYEALEYLDLFWPEGRTVHYRRARALCEAATEGLTGSEEARVALLDAARRADVLADGWEMHSARANDGLVRTAISSQVPRTLGADDGDVCDGDLMASRSAAEIVDDPALPLHASGHCWRTGPPT